MTNKKQLLEETAWYLVDSVSEQLSRTRLVHLKKSTLKTMVGELIAGIIKDGTDLHPRFFNEHAKVYKANREKVINIVVSQIV